MTANGHRSNESEHTSPDDHDIERRLLRGDKLYKCTECDLEILVVPPDETGQR